MGTSKSVIDVCKGSCSYMCYNAWPLCVSLTRDFRARVHCTTSICARGTARHIDLPDINIHTDICECEFIANLRCEFFLSLKILFEFFLALKDEQRSALVNPRALGIRISRECI